METPFDHYCLTREAFASGQTVLDLPIGRRYAPTQAIMQLVTSSSNFVPFLDQPLSLALRCQLALLWSILGFENEAALLAGELIPLIEEGFFNLWSSEKQYDEAEAILSANLLMRAVTSREMGPPQDSFFAFLFEKNPKINPVFIKQDLLRGENSALILTNQVQAGSLRVGKLIVPAFGPQTAPFSNSDNFGVCAGENRWICASASKDSWFQIDPISSQSFDLQAISNNPLPFVFYVRSEECMIGDRLFKPNSLQRFSSRESSIHFRQSKEKVEFTCDRALGIELIPLAGESSFWGASFLLSFNIPPTSGKIRFSFLH